MCYTQILFLFTTCFAISFSRLQAPPTLNDFFELVLLGNIAFNITAVGANVVVQSCHGKNADRNGIASEGTIF